MSQYRFDIIDTEHSRALGDDQRRQLLARPAVSEKGRLRGSADRYVPDDDLRTAINTAIAVGQPLLLTGESGTGKTQAAYYVSYRLGVPLFHFQARSTSVANDLLYTFDTVAYFHQANIARAQPGSSEGPESSLNKRAHVKEGELWKAILKSEETGLPSILLIDEIDKAPRDFPNDLLHEISEMSFQIREIPDHETIKAKPELRPIVFITSNDERRLPDAFLRRCVSHHIELTPERLTAIAAAHKPQYPALSEAFIKRAIERFVEIRVKKLEKPPATGELLTWLQVLSVAFNSPDPAELDKELHRLPFISTILKSPDTPETLRKSSR